MPHTCPEGKGMGSAVPPPPTHVDVYHLQLNLHQLLQGFFKNAPPGPPQAQPCQVAEVSSREMTVWECSAGLILTLRVLPRPHPDKMWTHSLQPAPRPWPWKKRVSLSWKHAPGHPCRLWRLPESLQPPATQIPPAASTASEHSLTWDLAREVHYQVPSQIYA